MGGWAPVIAAGILVGAAINARAEDAAVLCGSAEVAGGQVVRISDGRSFVLDDGREIRLAALEVPPEADAAGQAARTALAGIVGDKPVVLRASAEGLDRYGRLV